ncbi:MAG: sel1 repeat family protein [Motiliproteus sp.]|nr:sel1 repeat family protein [Motiliproteus sp.]MCW9053970.1 sel1 repeat family protein [Motiliproteus sp.]
MARYPALSRALGLSLLLSASLPLKAETPLPDDFVSALPPVQLFKAYAEFKMANYDLAKQMWLSIKGGAQAEALFNLAILYDQGLGAEEDIQQALDYYQQAARLGSRSAAYQLGIIYLNDKRIEPDPVQAQRWLTVAAHDGDEEAAQLLKQLAGESKGDPMVAVQQLLVAGEMEAAVAELELLAAANNATAITRLAWLYESGLGVEQNLQQAARLFRQAAELNDAEAQYALAVMLMTGSGQTQDRDQAISWLRRAAAQGHRSAQQALSAYQNE